MCNCGIRERFLRTAATLVDDERVRFVFDSHDHEDGFNANGDFDGCARCILGLHECEDIPAKIDRYSRVTVTVERENGDYCFNVEVSSVGVHDCYHTKRSGTKTEEMSKEEATALIAKMLRKGLISNKREW